MPKITIRVVNPGKQEAQVVSELSFGNLFIRSERFLAVGSRVQVSVHLPSSPEPLALEGRVARIVDDESARERKACGMALDVALDEAARARVAELRAQLQMPPVAFLSGTGSDPLEDASRLFDGLREPEHRAVPDFAQFEATQPGFRIPAAFSAPAARRAGKDAAQERIAELEEALASRDADAAADKARHDEAMKKLYVELATLRAAQRPTTAAIPQPPSPRPPILAGLVGLLTGAALVIVLLVLVRPDLHALPAMPWHHDPAADAAAVTVKAPAIESEAQPRVEAVVAEPPVPAPVNAPAAEIETAAQPEAASTEATPIPSTTTQVKEPERSSRSGSVKSRPERAPVSPEAGTLNLRADHPAVAYVNGRRAGTTPLNGLRVKPGRVSVRFDCEVEHITVHGAQRTVRVPAKGQVNVDHECVK